MGFTLIFILSKQLKEGIFFPTSVFLAVFSTVPLLMSSERDSDTLQDRDVVVNPKLLETKTCT